jgi:hypothetical protein
MIGEVWRSGCRIFIEPSERGQVQTLTLVAEKRISPLRAARSGRDDKKKIGALPVERAGEKVRWLAG